MNNRILVTVAAVAAALALGSSLAVWGREHPPAQPAPAAEAAHSQEGVPLEAPPAPSQSDEEPLVSGGYWLRDWEGRLGVFVGNSDSPEMVFDVYVKNLPDADRELLAKGLYVAEYADLVSRIEDYIS